MILSSQSSSSGREMKTDHRDIRPISALMGPATDSVKVQRRNPREGFTEESDV